MIDGNFSRYVQPLGPIFWFGFVMGSIVTGLIFVGVRLFL